MPKIKQLAFLMGLIFLFSACAEKQSDTDKQTAQSSSPMESKPPAQAETQQEMQPTEPPDSQPTEAQETMVTAPTQEPAQTTEMADASQTTAAETTIPTAPAAPADSKPEAEKPASEVMDIARKGGCLACHKVDVKVVGPAWKDVAKRYAGDVNARQTLINKVKKGGKGNWKEITGGIAMPPYSPRVSDANIEKLVDFILSSK